MTIRMDNSKVLIEEQDDSSDEVASDEEVSDEQPEEENATNETDSEDASDEEVSDDQPDEENVTNETDSEDASSDNSDTEEVPAKKSRVEEIAEEEDDDDDDGDDEGSDINSDNNDGDGDANLAWADSIAKILKTNKPKKKKTLVLSKAKKLTDPVKEKAKPAGYEIATADGEIKEEKIAVKVDAKEESDKLPRKKKKDVLSFRVKPSILNRDRERLLAKIATKGVVQLFNAVKTQQKDITSKLESAGPLEMKRDKVLKSVNKDSFLNVLMGEKSTHVDETLANSKDTKKEDESKSSWNVLRDDFMMGAKMKDWDKELEGDDEEEQEVEMESD